MDFVRKKRIFRLIPLGLGATFLLYALAHFAPHSHNLYPDDDPFFPHGPPPPPPHLFREGRPPPPPPPHHEGSTKWSARADAVRGAFKHAYGGYLKHAGEHDELLPVSDSYVNK